MSPIWCVLLVFVRTADLRHIRTSPDFKTATGLLWTKDAELEEQQPTDKSFHFQSEVSELDEQKRVLRGFKDGKLRRRDPQPVNSQGSNRHHDDPSGYFTTPRLHRVTYTANSNASSGQGTGLLNPLYPVTDGSYWAYAVMLLALIVFAVGIVGNLALMCIVWHTFHLKSAWNCILAGLAFWDFLVLFFCLPVVVFHELTLKRLLGDVSCRLVPYLEVSSLGVATFSLCALSIDRFHAATDLSSVQTPKVEPCQSILSKLFVIWLGSMVLAAPELLLWQPLQEAMRVPMPTPHMPPNQPAGSLMAALRDRTDTMRVDICVREPYADLPENIYALVLTYHEARMWWIFGCYLCMPLLFTLACDLVTRQVLAQRLPQKPDGEKEPVGSSPSSSSSNKKHQVREQRLRSTVMALTTLYIICNLPQSIFNIALAYLSAPVKSALPPLVLPALALTEQFLLFVRCSATPVLLLCLCRTLGQAFMDCCCCCCEECLPDNTSSAASSASTAAASALSSPTAASPESLLPIVNEEMKSLLHAQPACEKAKDSPAALGTPC